MRTTWGLMLTLAMAGIGATANPVGKGSDTVPVAVCDAPEFHQFDFFAGDWDVYDIGSSTVSARN